MHRSLPAVAEPSRSDMAGRGHATTCKPKLTGTRHADPVLGAIDREHGWAGRVIDGEHGFSAGFHC